MKNNYIMFGLASVAINNTPKEDEKNLTNV